MVCNKFKAEEESLELSTELGKRSLEKRKQLNEKKTNVFYMFPKSALLCLVTTEYRAKEKEVLTLALKCNALLLIVEAKTQFCEKMYKSSNAVRQANS